jgi:hypothetical protein
MLENPGPNIEPAFHEMTPSAQRYDQSSLSDSGLEPVFVGPQNSVQEIDGLELGAAAHILSVSIDELWRRIKNGQLLARTVRGKVFVYTDLPAEISGGGLPPVPTADLIVETAPSTATAIAPVEPSFLTHTPGNQEWALLLDHLSLAKEENREILRLTQDSMSRLTQMTDSILEMKDSIIASKEEQLAIMKERLAQKESELGRALKEKENLETLTQALTS